MADELRHVWAMLVGDGISDFATKARTGTVLRWGGHDVFVPLQFDCIVGVKVLVHRPFYAGCVTPVGRRWGSQHAEDQDLGVGSHL